MAYDINKKTNVKHLKDLATRLNAELTPVKTRVEALEDVGAQANVLESIKVNGTAQAITDKSVDITVPTNVSDLNNDSKFQTDTDVAAAVAAADHLKRKIVDSVDAIDKTADDATQYIYMVLKSSTKSGDKYDEYMVIDGEVERVGDWTVDLSGYQPKEDGKGLSTNDYTAEDKTKLGGVAEGATKVEASETDGAIKINGTDVQVVDIATDAEVTEMLNEVFGTASEG